MTVKTWQYESNQTPYVIKLTHQYWTNHQTLHINNVEVYKTGKTLQLGGIIRFRIDEHDCAIFIRNKTLRYEFEFVVDSVSTSTDRLIALPDTYSQVPICAQFAQGNVKPENSK